eukprot:CAMPEP_0201283038 /NCGR_PEP_ID=MMETSP1317-20130820/7382_1 /ASSEMBLY_ACC=CAM_ASM_000770 /TAXON_ID=187299 /ORGANISM="Undescribed Undescribed, Strain Undescribed" /LENGTH=41 /DNA_ID= /DNA_START= /DNA_END= /DNA_ORIENTATION=
MLNEKLEDNSDKEQIRSLRREVNDLKVRLRELNQDNDELRK